ncbi:glycosyltransferase family 4 protein [Methylobacterium nodulans]|uniref:Glycosyl transferase group 1 n=1 Tax=Methylobacterium nodulans (strain LMG 21967 / CNCM I-2342 / ORS 2060) TaxID=460265 RepID=B8ICC5_METNO|nr:glycosyltransferase family 4 protein [Methylobacterium nodulans]ACL55513.1 glycosyl transferase group 1 [Methylobacterium nodulans ORS 2060]
MHVAILTNFCLPRGGGEKVAIESARGLAEAGVAVSFLHGVDGPADPMLDHPGIRRIGLGLTDVWDEPAWRGARDGIWNRLAARRLRAALAELRPDCLHLHNWTRSLSPAVLPVLAGCRLPVAVTLHDYFLVCPNGVYYRFDRAEPCSLAPLGARCLASPCDPQSRAHKLVRVARAAATRIGLMRGFGDRAIDLVHVSDASRARLEPMLPGSGFRHHRIDNPVRVERRAPADPARGDAVVFVGRFTREKGADLVAEAARMAGLPALFIGDGPLAEKLAAMPGVEVLGWREPAAVEALLRARARAVVAPSRWLETGPLTVYEALACGIPAIASNRAGAAARIVPGETGFVTAPEAHLLARIFHDLADDALARRMGLAAHARYWAAPLTLAAHAEGAARLYATMIGRPAPLGATATAPSFQRSPV